MQILLDDKPYSAAGGPGQTVGQLAEQIGSNLAEEDRFLVAIRCDGTEVAPQQWEQVLGRRLEEYECVEFQSESGPGLAVRVLAEARALLEQTDQQCDEAVELLMQAKMGAGMRSLAATMSAWHQAHHAVVQAVELLKLDLGQIKVGQEHAATIVEDLRTQLSQIKSALAAGDLVLLADMLQYEFASTLGRWQAMIEAMIEHIRSTRNVPPETS